MNGPQIGLMALEVVSVSVLFLVAFRLRAHFGLVPVYTLLGVLFYTCNFLAATVYLRAAPELVVSPGTVAFFPAIVFVVLCVYITEDVLETRKLIYGLLACELFTIALGWATALHLALPGILNPDRLAPTILTTNLRVSLVSIVALFTDTVLIVLVYELVSRATRLLYLRIFGAAAVVLGLDSLLFITGSFVESPQYGEILRAALVGKTLAALLYAALFTVYLRYFDLQPTTSGSTRELAPTFRALTYRQKFELLQARSVRDALTGLYNRGFFEELLPTLTSAARRADRPLACLIVDIDHFKRVNDTYGHTVGDQVLSEVAAILARAFRASDYVCRYGGEEFAVLLPNTDLATATLLGEKTRQRIAEQEIVGQHITVTVGISVFPGEAESGRDFIELADRRLYAGKNSGRNQVVGAPGYDMIAAVEG